MNGLQGLVRKLKTGVDPYRLTFCTGALVEFPDSQVHIDSLRPHCFPLYPITWSFTTIVCSSKGAKLKVSFTRHQLLFEPGFAVTGHSAQGKTLPAVICNLHEGGFVAYIAASRATCHDGLFITRSVSQADLNKKLPFDLWQQSKRFNAMEHNTLVRYGFLNANLVSIPDHEFEKNISHHTNLSFEIEHSKCKPSDTPGELVPGPPPKKSKTNQKVALSVFQPRPPPFAGCVWSSTDWLCAYDSIFMVLFNLYHQLSPQLHIQWRSQKPLQLFVAGIFEGIRKNCSTCNPLIKLEIPFGIF